MNTTEKIVFQQDNKQVIQEGAKFFTRVFEGEECFESGDFKTIEKAKANLDIIPTIEENNNLIAEFMGATFSMVDHTEGNEDYLKSIGEKQWLIKTWTKPEGIPSYEGWGKYTLGKFSYHSDWNWLMGVVEKIKGLGFKFNCFLTNEKSYTTFSDYTDTTQHSFVCIGANGKSYDTENNSIKAVYNACVEFVKWYNVL